MPDVRRIFTTRHRAGFLLPEKRHRTLNALVVANTGLSTCWLFRQELLVCHVNQKGKKTC
ncbi:hypothetical protein AW064_25795 [Escherichia coli]|nr:hypothetical protein AW064_25795 [Escherichia coli]OTE37516.1 hypothetical protein AW117_25695 [Escherichia coli]